MAKILSKIALWGSVLIVAISLAVGIPMYAWMNSCDYFYDRRLHNFVDSTVIDSNREMRTWVKDHYGWVVGEVTQNEISTDRMVYWQTPFRDYTIRQTKEGNIHYATVRFIYKRPAIKDMLRCYGSPSYYEAYNESYSGLGDGVLFKMWWPSDGIFAYYEQVFYHWSYSFLERGFYVSEEDTIPRILFVEPGDINKVAADVYETHKPAELLKFLSPIERWQGIAQIQYYFMWELDEDTWRFYPADRLEKRLPDKRFGSLVRDFFDPVYYYWPWY